MILGVGYPQYYPWLRTPLPGARHILWIGESLPATGETLRTQIRRRLPMGRVLGALSSTGSAMGWRSLPDRLAAPREQAAIDHDQRFNLAACRRASRQGLELVVTSSDRRPPSPLAGSRPGWSRTGTIPRTLDPHKMWMMARDIDVLVLATAVSGSTSRRARIVAATIAELGPSIRYEVVERGLFGVERHRNLGRTRVVLNVHRIPAISRDPCDSTAAAGALLVSEPIDAPAPFVPGRHYVEARADDLASTVQWMLADRERRLEIARAGQGLVVGELTMTRSLRALLKAAV